MKSVVVKRISDFEKIDEYTEEIEFVEYNDVFSFEENCILPSVTFTKMYVYLDILPISVERLGLFDCEFDDLNIDKLVNLKKLEITNNKIDINDLVMLSIEYLSLNFCEILNYKDIVKLENLKILSLIESNIDDFNFLVDLKLDKVVVDDKTYNDNKEVFDLLNSRGVIVCDMMGGLFQ